MLGATERIGEVMSAHQNETAEAHTHAVHSDVFPQGFGFPSQIEALVARSAKLETVLATEAVVDDAIEAEEVHSVAVDLPAFSNTALTFKRIIDIAVATICLVIGSPLFLVVALVVRFSSKGPVLFRQQRIGVGGEPFSIVKFRTMRHGADKHLRKNPQLWDEYVRNDYKLPESHGQITKVGYVLRKLSLDELPQLWNVLRGHMSVVGVRPLVKEEFEGRPLRHQALYVLLPPGITGLWQVRGRSSTRHAERIALDDEYIRTWSNRQDLAVLVRTPAAVLKSSRTS